MNYFLIFMTCALCMLCGCQPRTSDNTLASISFIDNNGFKETVSSGERLNQYSHVDFLKQQPYQKVLRIYQRDQLGDIRAQITSYHPNGQAKQYLEVVNNRACGFYREWHVNGIMKLEACVVGGAADIDTNAEGTWLFEGVAKAWDEQGKLQAEIPYVNGEMQGTLVYYHPNGNTWKKAFYHKGLLNGTYEIFLEDGTVLQTTEFLNGEKNGLSKRFWDNCRVAAEEAYVNGSLNSARYYNLSGNEISKVEKGQGYRVLFGKTNVSEMHEITDGREEGKVKVFDADGSLTKVYHIENNIKHGEEIEYYPLQTNKGSKQPKLAINWVEGRIQGQVKTWYQNGAQESQRQMTSNKKNGILTGWYADGSIMLIEEYEFDKLINGKYYILGENSPVSEIKNGKGTATICDSKGNLLRKVIYQNSQPTE